MMALSARAEALRLVVMVDPSQAAWGLAAIQEYVDEEDDPIKKSKAELDAGHMLFQAKKTMSAIEQYRRILVLDPQNLEAIFGYGMSLYQLGQQDRFQEAARYLEFFLEQAPSGDPLRQVAANTLESLNALR